MAAGARKDLHMILTILKLTFCLAGSYFSLSTGCEYRAYRGGHKYVKAFPAKSPYQRFFTLMQCEKDILKHDMGKLTYLGYAGVLLSTVFGLLILLPMGYLWFSGKPDLAELLVLLWACFSMGWGLLSFVLLGIDSLLNRFL